MQSCIENLSQNIGKTSKSKDALKSGELLTCAHAYLRYNSLPEIRQCDENVDHLQLTNCNDIQHFWYS